MGSLGSVVSSKPNKQLAEHTREKPWIIDHRKLQLHEFHNFALRVRKFHESWVVPGFLAEVGQLIDFIIESGGCIM